MMQLLDFAGLAIWRASWQAAVLALLAALLLWCFGERLAPRWRFLLWGIVLMRFLWIATPASPWSMFNLVGVVAEARERSFVVPDVKVGFTPATPMPVPASDDGEGHVGFARSVDPSSEVSPLTATPRLEAITSQLEPEEPRAAEALSVFTPIRVLSATWFAGSLYFGLRLVVAALVLRRRMRTYPPVTDVSVLNLLEETRRRMRIRRSPQLLVAPGNISPCISGTIKPRIVLPESVLLQSSPERMQHVLAHELSHLVRRDLWTNWLLLAARVLHWFNPIAWWVVREMQAEREAACDDLAFAALGDADRDAYAATIVALSASLVPSRLTPGLIGLFSSTCRVKVRVERLLRSRPRKTLRAPLAAGLLLTVGLLGLTDAMPGKNANAQPPQSSAPASEESVPQKHAYAISGRCVDDVDRMPISGVTIGLYRVKGMASQPEKVAETVTDADGNYSFTGLEPPRPEGRLDRLMYRAFGFAKDRPVGIGFLSLPRSENIEVRVSREASSLSGRVVDAAGKAVAGATVAPYTLGTGHPIPGLPSATTDADGRFTIENVGIFKWDEDRTVQTHFTVIHPDHPATSGVAKQLPADVVVTLPTGCIVTGTVNDGVTGQPAAEATITAREVDKYSEAHVATDATGRFRLVVPEGRYHFLAEAQDRVSVAITDQECLAGESLQLSAFTLIAGGLISGSVVNTATGKPVSQSERGEPIMLGFEGPSQPNGQVISPLRLADVDEQGRFTLRAAPGENYPYFVNIRGDRMVWDTRQQPPVVVKEGHTTIYNMLITPPVSPEEKLKAARGLVANLSKDPSDRTAQILLEFRKLSHTVDETELWCMLMRELVAIGPAAVPQLSAELDRTSDDRTLRRLAFALRAIDDPRAVPALIRALPKSLLPSSSDYGLNVEDKELMVFMQQHDLGKGEGGRNFDLGRPPREIIGALRGLTGQDFEDAELFGISLSDDPRRQLLQRRIYLRQAERWQQWWEANWRNFTEDPAYQQVNLKVADEPLPPAPRILSSSARLGDGLEGAVLSPASEEGRYVTHAYDLDTGYEPKWPKDVPRDESARDEKQLAEWAARTGVDLICVTHRSSDGTETYVLRAMGMQVREITPRDLRNLDRLVSSGSLPEGRPVEALLMHYDPKSQSDVPDANAAFFYVTREGNWESSKSQTG